ncbi:crossover junction endodeoxyribonuclease RuvC [Bacillus pseudomycoides]|nr:crossover junction endodeoxyribonuclease RuvC [Bacillus pseudomycoides]
MGEYLLGLDISGSSTGFAVIEYEILDGLAKLELSKVGHIKTSSNDPDGVRMQQIRDIIEQTFERYPINQVIREGSFVARGRNRSTELVQKAVGVSELTSADNGFPEIVAYAPSTIKKEMTGNGRAEKGEVAEVVFKYFPKERFTWKAVKDKKTKQIEMKVVDDETDACAVILTHLVKRGLI